METPLNPETFLDEVTLVQPTEEFPEPAAAVLPEIEVTPAPVTQPDTPAEPDPIQEAVKATPVAKASVEPNGEQAPHEATKTLPNGEQLFEVTLPKTQGSTDKLELPPENTTVIQETLMYSPAINLGTTSKQQHWVSVLQRSAPYVSLGDHMQKRLADKKAKFTQSIEHRGQRLHGVAPSPKLQPGTTEMEGERALLQMVSHLGIGGLTRIPLFNSGFWVFFKPASPMEMLTLRMMTTGDKVELGRRSYGLTHSNHIVYSLSRIFEMALAHVYATSVDATEMHPNEIRKYLKPQDLHVFIWGFLFACYPSGFRYETACIENPEKCQHVFEGTLAISKIRVDDSNLLSDKQKAFMCSFSSNSRKLKEVLDYQTELTAMQDKRIIFNEGSNNEVAITLQTPSVVEYIEQGYSYINSIVDSVTKAMAMDASDQERTLFMEEASRSSTLCQYIHFVKSVEFGQLSKPDGAVVKMTDRSTVMDALKVLSPTASLREAIIKAILDYIAESTVSIIAMPAYDCPVCKAEQDAHLTTRLPKHTAYIPLDIIQIFFGLLAQYTERIQEIE